MYICVVCIKTFENVLIGLDGVFLSLKGKFLYFSPVQDPNRSNVPQATNLQAL